MNAALPLTTILIKAQSAGLPRAVASLTEEMTEPVHLIEYEDRWVLPMNGRVVTQCLIDFAFSLVFWDMDESSWSIRIEGEFTLRIGKTEHRLKAETDPVFLAPALALFQKSVVSAIIYKTGTLDLSFTDDTRLTAPPDPESKYEAWILNGPHGVLMVCLPTGMWPCGAAVRVNLTSPARLTIF